MRLATVTHEFLQPIRDVKQNASGGSYLAIFTLRLSPVPDIAGVEFSCEVENPDLKPFMVSAIEQGIRLFVERGKEKQVSVGCLRVALVDIHINPRDSREIGFIKAAYSAMTQAFEAHGRLIDSPANETDPL